VSDGCSMISVAISPDLKAIVPNVVVGCITANVRVTEHDNGLWEEIEVAEHESLRQPAFESGKIPHLHPRQAGAACSSRL
jgi:hypothetical protein